MFQMIGFKKYSFLFGILFLLGIVYTVHAQNYSNKGIRVFGHTGSTLNDTQSDDQYPLGSHFTFFRRLHELKGLLKELNLTEEQKSALIALKGSCREEVKAVMEQHQALRKIVLAETSDQAAIQNTAAQLGNTIGAAAVKVSSVVGRIREILTDEQEALLKAHLEEHLKNKEDHLEALHCILDELIPTPSE